MQEHVIQMRKLSSHNELRDQIVVSHPLAACGSQLVCCRTDHRGRGAWWGTGGGRLGRNRTLQARSTQELDTYDGLGKKIVMGRCFGLRG